MFPSTSGPRAYPEKDRMLGRLVREMTDQPFPVLQDVEDVLTRPAASSPRSRRAGIPFFTLTMREVDLISLFRRESPEFQGALIAALVSHAQKREVQ